ncbi:MAG: serine protease [Actinomycetota bacterium]|nr:serine protease [Actinomycetota bacterium]
MPGVESFWRRHFTLSSPMTIMAAGVVIALVTGLIGATIWTSSDSAEVRSAGSSAASIPLPTTEPTSEQQTTTTKPDLSMDAIEKKIAPLVWTVNTLDQAGQPSVASAFVVGAAGGQTFLITSLAAVNASTQMPAPVITVQNGSFNGPATLWTWEDDRDLALLAVSRPRAENIEWDNEKPDPKAGDRIFAIAGGPDNRVTPGLLTAVNGGVFQHNIFIDDARRGGPIVNIKGEVIGISSAAFTGGGLPTDAAFFAVPIHGLCDAVMVCGGANAPQAGTPGATKSSSSSSSSTTSTPSSTGTRRTTTTTTAPDDTTDAPTTTQG